MSAFPRYKTIHELYAYSGYNQESKSISFDILHFSDLGPYTKKVVPPHRRDFFTVIFFENQQEGKIQLNVELHRGLENVLLFQGPDHVFSFTRDEEVSGFIILFDKAFLAEYYPVLDNNFPFFSIYHQNLYHLNDNESDSFTHIIRSLFLERKSPKVSKPLLVAFLQKSLVLFSQYMKEEKFLSPKSLLIRRFKQLIGNHYAFSKNVEYYAELLAVSPAYLNEASKGETGRTPKQLILERILLEAENMLIHTELDVAQISHMLNFTEPTHFVRFFKKEKGLTPKVYRTSML
ncbi:MAG: AraC family transcriptional regulator [Bacteroidota bacterium]